MKMTHKLLGRSGLRVSELCLGTMTFGTEWHIGADRAASEGVFQAFCEADGNFLDTANNYSCGTGERWVGEMIRSDRDHFVLASKYSCSDRQGDPNFSGNHRKNLMRSVRGSLERLGTDHLDLLWVHFWDGTTPVEEILRGCDDLVHRGLVHHIGFSDMPAWIVAQAQTTALLRGWTPLVALQIEYSLLRRDAERDLLPMARAFDLPVIPWGVLGGGALTGKYLRGDGGRLEPTHRRRQPWAEATIRETCAIAVELGVPPAQVALAWSRQRGQPIIPLVGARQAEQFVESLGAIEVVLPPDAIARLDQVSAIELGFPHEFLSGEHMDKLTGGSYSLIEPWEC